MAFSHRWFCLLTLHVLCSFISEVNSSPHPILSSAGEETIKLHAARRSSHLPKRDDQVQLSNFAKLRYIDDNRAGHGTIFYAEVSIRSPKPLLLLEDIENKIDRIACNSSTIELHFIEQNFFTTIESLWDGLVSGYAITSHTGCNDEGARLPFLVSAVSHSQNDMIVRLEVEEKQWNELPGEITIDYGHTEEHHELRRHESLDRRQSASPTTTSQYIRTSLIPTSSPTDTSSTKVLDLAYESKPDSTFSFPLGLGPSAPLEIGCKLCKTTGNLKVTRGNFTLRPISNINIVGSNITSPLDYVTSGFMQLEMNDFSAHIDLEITPSLKGGMNYTLYPVPVFAFSIPRVGTAGLLYEPEVRFNWELKGGVKFSYGFELNVPSGSQISIDLVNRNNSSVTGFSKTTINSIPFQANISDIELSMSLALRSRVTVAFSFLDDHLLAEAAAYIDHPSQNINITQLSTSNADATCKGTDGIPFSEANFNQAFSNLTYISPEVKLAAGLEVKVQADIPALPNKSIAWDTILTEMSFLQPTACLVYQKSKGNAVGGSFATASVVFAEMKAEASSSSVVAAVMSASASAARAKETGGAKKSSATRTIGDDKLWRVFVCGFAIFATILGSM